MVESKLVYVLIAMMVIFFVTLVVPVEVNTIACGTDLTPANKVKLNFSNIPGTLESEYSVATIEDGFSLVPKDNDRITMKIINVSDPPDHFSGSVNVDPNPRVTIVGTIKQTVRIADLFNLFERPADEQKQLLKDEIENIFELLNLTFDKNDIIYDDNDFDPGIMIFYGLCTSSFLILGATFGLAIILYLDKNEIISLGRKGVR